MNVTDMSTADVLRKAKQVLIERGWTQGRYENKNGCVCAVGAINVVVHGAAANFNGSVPGFYARGALREANGDRPVTDLNDHVWQTEDDVLAAFDRAIALAESEASR
jgi:hypothetical protein